MRLLLARSVGVRRSPDQDTGSTFRSLKTRFPPVVAAAVTRYCCPCFSHTVAAGNSIRTIMELSRFLAPVALAAAVCFSFLNLVECKNKESRQLVSLSKETSTADFVRLVIMRLIFGLASAMGYGEGLSKFLGGIFAPPGVDYEDDYIDDFVPDLFE